jgi:hypothetical protein
MWSAALGTWKSTRKRQKLERQEMMGPRRETSDRFPLQTEKRKNFNQQKRVQQDRSVPNEHF